MIQRIFGQNLHFANAQEAFTALYDAIDENGEVLENGTKAFFNVGFYLLDPTENQIDLSWRKWNLTYAEREWAWYISGDRSVEEIKKYAPIWDTMHSGDNRVNSNYGWQWMREQQLERCIDQLKNDPNTRQAWLTIFDGKEKDKYGCDTPCTLSIGFYIRHKRLCMSVLMRSNDLWYGFCNDQYCFSKLQKMVADQLDLPVGPYYHYADNLHIYEQHYNMKPIKNAL